MSGRHGHRAPAHRSRGSTRPPGGGREQALPARLRPPRSRRLLPALLAVALGLAAALAYANSFAGEFIYDDLNSLRDNPCLRSPASLAHAVSLPLWSTGATLDARPVLAMSFAANFALHELGLAGYHLANLAIHLAAGLVLFALLRHTLRLPALRGPWAARADWLAFTAALLWLVHPLQTESVTYIVQRAESLAGLLTLLTLYAAARAFAADTRPFREDRTAPCAPRLRGGEDPGGPREPSRKGSLRAFGWYALALLACTLGAGVKEVVVVTPLLVYLYDALLVRRSFLAPLANRAAFYALLLLLCWGTLAALIAATFADKTTDFHAVGVWAYLRTEPGVVLHYLRLAVVPHPLILSYGWERADTVARVVPPLLAVLGLLGVTGVGVWRKRWYGFVGAWFFLALAPSSSLVPTQQYAFEHRMYLALAAVTVLAVLGGDWLVHRIEARGRGRMAHVAAAAVLVAVTGAWIWRTRARNAEYADPAGLWERNVALRPGAVDAHFGLGNAHHAAGRLLPAAAAYRRVLAIQPGHLAARINLALALDTAGRPEEALACYEESLRLGKPSAALHNNFAIFLEKHGDLRRAAAHYRRALALAPNLGAPCKKLGNLLLRSGALDDALPYLRRAVQNDPSFAAAHNDLAVALEALGHLQEAHRHYGLAVRLQPANDRYRRNLDELQRRLADGPALELSDSKARSPAP